MHNLSSEKCKITCFFDDHALLQLGWEVLIHLPVCQTVHLQISIYFSLYKILLMEKYSNSLEDCKKYLKLFFAQKDKKFWEDAIMKLLEKWQKVVE